MRKRRLAAGAVGITLALTMVPASAFAASVTFTDVPSDHWASSFISEMADKGVMSGVGNNKFSPSSTLTGAEFVTMVVRQFYEDKIGASGDVWYSTFMDVAEKEGILSGTGITAEGTISRYDMAQLMYNVLKAQGVTTSPLSDTSKVADWSSVPSSYRDAVSVCYNMGMLSGIDSKGTFGGNGNMDRAQAAVVMSRLIDVCGDSSTTTPEVPAGAVQILPGDSAILKVSNGTPIEGGYEFDTSGAINAAGTDKYAWMHIKLGGKYTTLTFTVTAIDNRIGVAVNSRDNSLQPTLLTEEQLNTFPEPGKPETYVVDVSGVNEVSILVGSRISHATVTDITLS